MKLDSSVAAVVTGGASGLGEATARALAAQGVKVAIFDMNDAKGEKVAFMSKMATFTPCAASARAVASPRPEAPPVTTAATEESSFMERALEVAFRTVWDKRLNP